MILDLILVPYIVPLLAYQMPCVKSHILNAKSLTKTKILFWIKQIKIHSVRTLKMVSKIRVRIVYGSELYSVMFVNCRKMCSRHVYLNKRIFSLLHNYTKIILRGYKNVLIMQLWIKNCLISDFIHV